MRYSLVAMVLLAFTPAWVQAQVKFPVFDESEGNPKNVVFKDATDHADYQHGRLLRVTLNGGSNPTVKGILVRTDSNKRLIYLRTQPGAPPHAIAVSEIKRIEKGVIKEAADSSDVAAPEIWQTVIFNGNIRRVSYAAPTLSTSELKVLSDFKTAENDLANMEFLAPARARASQ